MLLVDLLQKYRHTFLPVVKVAAGKDRIIGIDLSDSNTNLTEEVISDIHLFEKTINEHLNLHDALFAIGGYCEHRNLYRRSDVFNGSKSEEPRRNHLGIDIWGKAGTEIFAPMNAVVHSIADNDTKGDYGATIILQHQLENIVFHTLYGHLSKADLTLKSGDEIVSGQLIAHFGNHLENGYWPPHLHFQVIQDLEGNEGDYPGVCSNSTLSTYQHNCPDPDLILNLNRFK